MPHGVAKKKKKGFWDIPGGWILDWGAKILYAKKKMTSVIGLGLVLLKYDLALTKDICGDPVSR